MSFALKVKEELCGVSNPDSSSDFIEALAMIRYGCEISMSSDGLKLVFSSTSLTILRHFLMLLKKFHNVETKIESRIIKQFEEKTTYSLYILNQVDVICEDFGILNKNKLQNEEIIINEAYAKAYLRGAFLCKGSVNDPSGGNYHLEIKCDDDEEIIFLQQVFNIFDLNGKICKRRNHLILYVKDVNLICDFLRIIGSMENVFQIEDAVIKREIHQNISRNLNCELANETKTFQAAKEQMAYIQYLEYNYPLDKLDPKLLLIMKVRKEHMEASFNELLEILKNEYGEEMTKSGLNHRFRKLKEIATAYKKSRDK